MRKRKYLLNEQFLDRWSPKMAYVLGFWFADGYMRHEKSYRVIFTSKDYCLLLQIRKCLRSNHPIYRRKDQTGDQLILFSKPIYLKLLNLGGKRCKSKIMRFPRVPRIYLSDFIRGYFDGDGSVFYVNYISTKNHKPRRELRSNFTSGSRQFLGKLMMVLNKEIGLVKKQIGVYNQGNSLKLGYGTRDTERLLNFIYYPNFPIGLQRKAQFL